MALFDYDVCLRSQFVCDKPQHAAPGHKVRYQPLGGIDAWQPCVRVEARIGTSGTTVDRTAVGHYTGHVPDAPCMVGTKQTQLYALARQQTSWAGQKLAAVAKAALVGACVGLVLAAATLGVLAAANLFVGAAWAEPSVSLYLKLAAFQVPFLLILFGFSESFLWSEANALFGQLLELSRAFERKKSSGSLSADEKLAASGVCSPIWAVQQAALDLKGYVPIPEQKKEAA